MTAPLLFTPMSLRGLTLRNRVVVAPMHQYAAISGFPTDWHLMNAGRYAAGGVGLVMMESTKVERRGCGTVGDLGIWDDKFVAPLSRLVTFIKEQHAVAGIQLGHSGRKARATRPWPWFPTLRWPATTWGSFTPRRATPGAPPRPTRSRSSTLPRSRSAKPSSSARAT